MIELITLGSLFRTHRILDLDTNYTRARKINPQNTKPNSPPPIIKKAPSPLKKSLLHGHQLFVAVEADKTSVWEKKRCHDLVNSDNKRTEEICVKKKLRDMKKRCARQLAKWCPPLKKTEE